MTDKKLTLRQARGMMSNEEIKNHISPFLSKAWIERRTAIEKQVEGKIEKQRATKELKKQLCD